VACALLRKDVRPDYFTEAAIHDPEIEKLIGKTKLLPEIPPAKGPRTEINVKVKGGRTLSASTDFPKGHYLKSPLTADEIKAKFRNNVAYSGTVSPKNAEKAMEIILKLEDLKDMRELIRLLVK
jgi:2-methylcitrate dehydratase PrpD